MMNQHHARWIFVPALILSLAAAGCGPMEEGPWEEPEREATMLPPNFLTLYLCTSKDQGCSGSNTFLVGQVSAGSLNASFNPVAGAVLVLTTLGLAVYMTPAVQEAQAEAISSLKSWVEQRTKKNPKKNSPACYAACQCNDGSYNHPTAPLVGGVGFSSCKEAVTAAKIFCGDQSLNSLVYHGRHCSCIRVKPFRLGNGTWCESN